MYHKSSNYTPLGFFVKNLGFLGAQKSWKHDFYLRSKFIWFKDLLLPKNLDLNFFLKGYYLKIFGTSF